MRRVFHMINVAGINMKFTAVVEHCKESGLYAGYVPGFSGAHSQGKTLDELDNSLKDVIAMLLEDGLPELEAEFIC